MIAPLLLAASVASAAFRSAFPGAALIESPDSGRLRSASGFSAKGLGNTPEVAARAFLAQYGAEFGIVPPFELVTTSAPPAGQPGAVRFERRVEGLPVFDGDLAVGVDAENTIILVNTADVPPVIKGKARLSRAAAIRAAKRAIPNLESDDQPRAERGFKAFFGAVRPVWRVEFAARRPPGDFRSDVDAHTGKVLSRVNLRDSGAGQPGR
jgi:Zn-dependent metalloprotease